MALADLKHSSHRSPTILESFPTPPSYIPPPTPPSSAYSFSPHTNSSNPPPTLPPSLPLPPVPHSGFPILDEDALLFLSASRLRRMSKLSQISVASSRRDSTVTIASIASIGSNRPPSLSTSVSDSSASQSTSSSPRTRAAESAHSLRSFSSNGSLSVAPLSRSQPYEKSPRLSPTMEIAIAEENVADEAAQNLSAMSLQSPYPYSDRDGISPYASSSTRGMSARTTQVPGRTSPDINTIISATPRPRRRTSSILSAESSALYKPQPSSDVFNSQKSSPSWMLRKSESFESQFTLEKTASLADADSEFDELERELEGNGSESDSSLDLHTPFAHVMLRDGLISPRSKVISQLTPGIPRPNNSVNANDSTRTKCGVYKDERDTMKRRHRHRDGKLLRGGIGLTTGLGWSDSEDEDSPSPLTRRLSSMASSRKSSVSSLRSSFSSNQPRLSEAVQETAQPGSKQPPSAAYSTKTSVSMYPTLNHRLPPTPEASEDHDLSPLSMSNQVSTRSISRNASIPSLKSPNIGPRPLKLTQSSSMLRSSSFGNARSSEKVIMLAPSRLRTYSNPSFATPQTSIGKPAIGVPGTGAARTPGNSNANFLPNSNSMSTPSAAGNAFNGRKKSRIGTGMMYKRSASDSITSTRSSPVTANTVGNFRPLRMPSSPLHSTSVIASSPSSSSFGMEIGIAI